MILVLFLPPSRSKPISMPILRRKVAARRSRPDSARGLSGQVFDLATRSPAMLGKGAQKIRGGSRPLRPRRHHGAHGGGDRIGVDHALHRLVAVAAIGRPEGAGGPERGLAGRRPQREVGHARQLRQMRLGQPLQALDHRIEQHAEDARALGLERGPEFRPPAGGAPRGSAPASGTRRDRRGRAGSRCPRCRSGSPAGRRRTAPRPDRCRAGARRSRRRWRAGRACRKSRPAGPTRCRRPAHGRCWRR